MRIVKIYNRMQSYKLHIVSEHLKDRHPYLQSPFKARYNKSEVHYAVFDRSIPKLIEILLMNDIETHKYRDALITLNELSSNDSDKDNMVTQGLIGIASAFLHCQVVDIRREATLLLGSLLSVPRGLGFLNSQTFEGLQKLLFDQQIEVRNCVAWCIRRIVLSRAGVDVLCTNKIVSLIIKSFLKYSEGLSTAEELYIMYLLEAITHILSYDNGISFALGTGLTVRLNQLCKLTNFSKENVAIIHYLSLDNLSKIASNPKGKEEAIAENVIKTASGFLVSQIQQQVKNAVVVIMLTSIHLNGKKQCIYDSKGAVTSDTIVKLIGLFSTKDKHLKQDVIECLRIISQLKDGFLAITQYMAKEGLLQYIDQIFGSSVVVALADLLPCTQELEQPPILPSLKVKDYKNYAKALNYFLVKYDEALDIALEDTVDIVLKLLPFMCYRGDREVQEGTCESLIRLIMRDKYSKGKIREYLNQYGSVTHRTSQTTLLNQILNNKRLQTAIQG